MLLSNVCRLSNTAAVASAAAAATAACHVASARAPPPPEPTSAGYAPAEQEAAIRANLEYAAFLGGPYRVPERSAQEQRSVAVYANFYGGHSAGAIASDANASLAARSAPDSAALFRMVPDAAASDGCLVQTPLPADATAAFSAPRAFDNAPDVEEAEQPPSFMTALANALSNATATLPKRGLQPAASTLVASSAPFSTSAQLAASTAAAAAPQNDAPFAFDAGTQTSSNASTTADASRMSAPAMAAEEPVANADFAPLELRTESAVGCTSIVRQIFVRPDPDLAYIAANGRAYAQ